MQGGAHYQVPVNARSLPSTSCHFKYPWAYFSSPTSNTGRDRKSTMGLQTHFGDLVDDAAYTWNRKRCLNHQSVPEQ